MFSGAWSGLYRIPRVKPQKVEHSLDGPIARDLMRVLFLENVAEAITKLALSDSKLPPMHSVLIGNIGCRGLKGDICRPKWSHQPGSQTRARGDHKMQGSRVEVAENSWTSSTFFFLPPGNIDDHTSIDLKVSASDGHDSFVPVSCSRCLSVSFPPRALSGITREKSSEEDGNQY